MFLSSFADVGNLKKCKNLLLIKPQVIIELIIIINWLTSTVSLLYLIVVTK